VATPEKKCSRDNAVAIILNSNVCPFTFNRLFKCMYCENQFFTILELSQHTTYEHQDLTERDVRLAVSALSKKMPIKINVPDIICKLCYNELTDFNDLKHHLVGKHKIDIDFEDDGVLAYSITEDECICVRCGSKFDNYKVLNKHITDKHFNAYSCDKCGDGFATKAGLRSHENSHTSGSHPCEVCGRVYQSISSKRHHMKVAHLNVKMYKCTHCTETFRGYYQKLKHTSTVHGETKYYKCSFCPKTFLCNSALWSHNRVVHEQGHTYDCDNCDYRTYTKRLIRLHMSCHGEKQQFRCNACGEKFPLKKPLIRHKIKMHNYVRKYSCQVCSRSFERKCILNVHLKNRHQIETTDC
jgi:hypothetical protein